MVTISAVFADAAGVAVVKVSAMGLAVVVVGIFARGPGRA